MRRFAAATPGLALALALALASVLALGACRSTGPPVADDPAFSFTGNEALTRDELVLAASDHLLDFKSRDHAKAAIDDAAYRMEQRYRDLGYAFAEVRYAISAPPVMQLDETPSAGLEHVEFQVYEGPRILLEELAIHGGDALDRERLQALAVEAAGPPGEAVYSARAIDEALDAILADARSAGFRHARVELESEEIDRDAGRARVAIRVEPGLRYRLAGVEIEGEVPISEERLTALEVGELGSPYTPRLAGTVLSRVEEALRGAGYPDARAEIADVREDGGDVVLAIAVESGERVTITAVRFEGDLSTRKRVLRDLVSVRTGKPFSAEELRASFQRIYSTGLFETVRHRFDPPDGPERALVWDLVELPSLELWFEPGWGSYDGLRARAGANERNLLGTGLALRAEGLLSEKTARGKTGITNPRLFSSDVALDVSVEATQREEPSFEYVETAFETSLAYRWSGAFASKLAYRLAYSDLLDDDIAIGSLDDDVIDDFDIASLRFSSLLDKRDHIIRPTSGYRAEGSVEWGDAALGSEIDFLRTIGSGTAVHSLRNSTVLSMYASAGVIAPLADTTSIPLQERFFAGGEKSVRSFAEDELGPKDANGNPIGGEATTLLSAELRQSLPRKFEVVLFADTGNVVERYSDFFEFEGFRHAVGVGLLYELPVGPLRVDFGINPNPTEDEDEFAIHFAVGRAH